MSAICKDRVAIITGAGGGLGQAYAKAIAAAGGCVVVNDINLKAATATVQIIKDLGGNAISNNDDITDYAASKNIIKVAIDAFGDLHAVVNNAGICRDRMFFSLSEEDWDAVMRVHLKGHFCLSNHACSYWRAQCKEKGEPVSGRIINTTSGAGLLGSLGQSNYSAAKGGIASLTLVQAVELRRYGITANALAPSARTAMTTQVPEFAERMKKPEDDSFDYYSPDSIAPLVVWLASLESQEVSGKIFELEGDKVSLVDGWRAGPVIKKGDKWQPEELGVAVAKLIKDTLPQQKIYGE